MPSVIWGKDIADVYDTTAAAMFDPAVLDPIVDRLVELAGDGPALELAVGTGRVALALSARGVRVHGIELSPHMVDRLRAKSGADAVEVTVGDMTSTRLDQSFTLVDFVWITIMNVTTQDEQVAVFEHTAAHLRPSGAASSWRSSCPRLRAPPAGRGRQGLRAGDGPSASSVRRPGGQITWSHHWTELDGRLLRHSAPYRTSGRRSWT